MPQTIKPGDCVKTPDGRIARVRDIVEGAYRVRVRRTSGKSHQFLNYRRGELKKVDCPQGWMSPEGYNRYLKVTLEKMRKRAGKVKSKRAS